MGRIGASFVVVGLMVVLFNCPPATGFQKEKKKDDNKRRTSQTQDKKKGEASKKEAKGDDGQSRPKKDDRALNRDGIDRQKNGGKNQRNPRSDSKQRGKQGGGRGANDRPGSGKDRNDEKRQTGRNRRGDRAGQGSVDRRDQRDLRDFEPTRAVGEFDVQSGQPSSLEETIQEVSERSLALRAMLSKYSLPKAASLGNIKDSAGRIVKTLKVNDSSGSGTNRLLVISSGDELTVSLDTAPTGQQNGKYAVFGWEALPGTESQKRMGTAGLLAMNPVLASCEESRCPEHIGATIVNSTIGGPTSAATGAPLPGPVLYFPPGSFLPGTILYFQGVQKNAGSSQPNRLSTTNGVLVAVED